MNTATVDSEVLATSNGHSGRSRHAGSTSKGSANGAGRMAGIIPGLTAWLGLLAGGLVFVKTL